MGVLRDILDLFVIREESKKRQMELKIAETKLAEVQRRIVVPTDEEVRRYGRRLYANPDVLQVLYRSLENVPGRRRLVGLGILLGAIALAVRVCTMGP